MRHLLVWRRSSLKREGILLRERPPNRGLRLQELGEPDVELGGQRVVVVEPFEAVALGGAAARCMKPLALLEGNDAIAVGLGDEGRLTALADPPHAVEAV